MTINDHLIAEREIIAPKACMTQRQEVNIFHSKIYYLEFSLFYFLNS